MMPEMKSDRSAVSSDKPKEVLVGLLRGRPDRVTPEAAAERAANRIIRAVRGREMKELKKG